MVEANTKLQQPGFNKTIDFMENIEINQFLKNQIVIYLERSAFLLLIIDWQIYQSGGKITNLIENSQKTIEAQKYQKPMDKFKAFLQKNTKKEDWYNKLRNKVITPYLNLQ